MNPYRTLPADCILAADHPLSMQYDRSSLIPRSIFKNGPAKREDFELECEVIRGVIADYLVHVRTGCRIPLCPALPMLAGIETGPLATPRWLTDRFSVRKDQYDDLFQVVYVAELLTEEKTPRSAMKELKLTATLDELRVMYDQLGQV